MCKVYTGYCGTSEIEHGLCACTVDNPLAKARGLSLRTGAQTMLYLSLIFHSTELSKSFKCYKNMFLHVLHVRSYALVVLHANYYVDTPH